MSAPQPADSPETPVPFTDVVLLLYLDELPQHQDTAAEPHYEAESLRRAATGAFALGCAAGIEHPYLVKPILEQTHAGESDAIVAECTGTLTEQVAHARQASTPLEPSLFLEPLLEGMVEEPHVPSDAACHILSIGFEYGCILAVVEPRAARLVRNGFNRRQAETLRALEAGESAVAPLGLDPHQPIQQAARELVAAYRKDIGFGIE